MRHPELIEQALSAPITNPRRKLILVALAQRARSKLQFTISPVELCRVAGLEVSDVIPLINHIKTLEGHYLEFNGILDGAVPTIKVDLTKLAEADYFGDIA